MTDDAYAVCRYVKHYHAKNGYAPTREFLGGEQGTEALIILTDLALIRYSSLPSTRSRPQSFSTGAAVSFLAAA